MENTNKTEDTTRLRFPFMATVASHGNAYLHQCTSPSKVWGWAFGFRKPTDITFYVWDEAAGMYMTCTIQSMKTLVENSVKEDFTNFLGDHTNNITK